MDRLGADLWRQLGAQWQDLQRSIGFGDALALLPNWLAPLLAIGSLLALAILAGIALASLGVLLTTLLVATLLLERVFGVNIALS